MRLPRLALAIALTCFHAAPPLFAQDLLSRIEFRFAGVKTITAPKDLRFSASWLPESVRTTDDMDQAITHVQQGIQENPFVQTLLKSALERMQRYKSMPKQKMKLAPNGKITIVLNLQMPYDGSGAFMSYDQPQAGEFRPFVHLPAGNIPRPQLAPAGVDPQAYARKRTGTRLVHEVDHVDVTLAEIVADAKYGAGRPLAESGKGRHWVGSVSDEHNAFIEGKAEAGQLHALQEASLIDGEFFRDGMWNPGIVGIERERLSYENRDAVYLQEMSNWDPAESAARRLERLDRGVQSQLEMTSSEWYSPQLELGPSRVKLKTIDGLLSTEGVIALTLRDMYGTGLLHPQEVTNLVEQGTNTMQKLLRHLNEIKYKGDPAALALVDLIWTRQTMGCNHDPAKAARMFELRLSRPQTFTAELHTKALANMVIRKHGDAGRAAVELYNTSVNLDMAAYKPPKEIHPGSPRPSGRPDPLDSIEIEILAEPELPKAKPSGRVKALQSHGGSGRLLRWSGTLATGVTMAVGMGLVADVAKGKPGISSLEDFEALARRTVFDTKFVALTTGAILTQETAEGIGQIVMKKALSQELQKVALERAITGAASQRAVRLAVKQLAGGTVISLIAVALAHQVIAHDWSFISCTNLDLGDKILRGFKVVFTELADFNKKVVLDLALSTVGFAAGVAAVGIVTGGTGWVAIGVGMAVGFLASQASGFIAQAIDELQYRKCVESIRCLASLAGPNPMFPSGGIIWYDIDKEDQLALENAARNKLHPEVYLRLLAGALGRVGDFSRQKFTCQGDVTEVTKTITGGPMKVWLEKRELFVTNLLGEMAEYGEAHKKQLEEATAEVAKAADPSPGGLDLRRLVTLFGVDGSLRKVPAETVADLIVTVVRANPKLDYSSGASPDATDEQIDALHARYRSAVQPYLQAPAEVLAGEHLKLLAEMNDKGRRARIRFDDLQRQRDGEVRDKLRNFLKRFKQLILEERFDLKNLGLDPLFQYNLPLAKFVIERLANLEAMGRAYEELYRLNDMTPRRVSDEALQHYQDMVGDWTPARN